MSRAERGVAGKQDMHDSVHPLRRKILSHVVPPLLRQETHVMENGIEQAEQFLLNGGSLIVAYTHPGKKETAGVYAIPFSSKVLAQRRIIEPVAIHQRQAWFDFSGKLLGVEFKYIITDDTIDYDWEHQMEHDTIRDYSQKEAMQKAALKRILDVLSEGGILKVAPQGGRRTELRVPERATLGTLIAEIRRRGIKTAILPIGVGLRGVTDYKKAKGYNFTKKQDLVVGNLEDVEDIYKKAGSYRNIDRYVVNNMFANLVSEAYLDIPEGV